MNEGFMGQVRRIQIRTIPISLPLLSLSSLSPPSPPPPPPPQLEYSITAFVPFAQRGQPKFRPGETLAEFSVKPPSSRVTFFALDVLSAWKFHRVRFGRREREKRARAIRKNVSVLADPLKNLTSREGNYRGNLR